MAPVPSIALALGGGGARGLAHIHVIEAFDDLGIRPVAIAGSSIGSMMGAGMAAGLSGADIHEHARALLCSKTEVISRVWRAQKASFTSLTDGALQFGRFNAEAIMREFLPKAVPATFEELKIPLHVTGTDFYGHRLAVFSSGDLVSALAASIALPAVFKPVQRDGMMLIDGGFFDPVPHDILAGKADIIVAVDVVGVPQAGGKKMPSTIDLLYGSTQLMMHSITEAKRQINRPDIFLRPEVGHFRVLDFLKMETILKRTEPIRDELKRELDRVISARMAGRET